MRKLLISGLIGLTTLVVSGVVGAPVVALDAEPVSEAISESQVSEPRDIAPTFAFTPNENDKTATFKLGHNLVLTGNNLNSEATSRAGFMFALGNNLSLRTAAEYSFIAGNTINFAGEAVRDLYLAGNSITLHRDARIGRDVFIAGNTVTINANIAGDLSVGANTVVLKDVKISGNLNLDATRLEIFGQVEVAGTVTYNDDTTIYNDNSSFAGIKQIQAGKVETYHVAQIDPATAWENRIYSTVNGAIMLFIVIVVICALYPRLHQKLGAETTAKRFGVNIMLGLGFLIAVPVLALFALITLVAAPLGIIAGVLYVIALYLAQGFAGIWLGHALVEKLCKAKGNIFVEALIGITLLSALSLVPYLGATTSSLGLMLGLGLIISCVKPAKKVVIEEDKPAPKRTAKKAKA